MRRLLVVAVVVLLYAVPAQAQVNPVPVGQPINVAWDHTGLNVTGFQCGVDGKPTGTVLAVTARACVIPGQAVGVHTVMVSAVNAFGTGTTSVSATAGTAPDAPTNLRIVMQVAVKADGTAELLAFNVEKQ